MKRKYNFLILFGGLGLLSFTSLTKENNDNNIVYHTNLKNELKNSSLKDKFLEFKRTIKNNEKYSNVLLFNSENDKDIIFKKTKNDYIDIINVSNKSTFTLYFDNNFSIDKDIEKNYNFLINELRGKLDLKNDKNYNEKITNFDYKNNDSFNFSGYVVSRDNKSEREFRGTVKDPIIDNFYVNFWDYNKKINVWSIVGIVLAVIGIIIMIVSGLYALAGFFGALAEAGGEGAVAGAEGATAGAAESAGGTIGGESSLSGGENSLTGSIDSLYEGSNNGALSGGEGATSGGSGWATRFFNFFRDTNLNSVNQESRTNDILNTLENNVGVNEINGGGSFTEDGANILNEFGNNTGLYEDGVEETSFISH